MFVSALLIGIGGEHMDLHIVLITVEQINHRRQFHDISCFLVVYYIRNDRP